MFAGLVCQARSRSTDLERGSLRAALECAASASASASPLKVWSTNDGLGLRFESARTGEIVPTLLCLSSRQARAGIARRG